MKTTHTTDGKRIYDDQTQGKRDHNEVHSSCFLTSRYCQVCEFLVLNALSPPPGGEWGGYVGRVCMCVCGGNPIQKDGGDREKFVKGTWILFGGSGLNKFLLLTSTKSVD